MLFCEVWLDVYLSVFHSAAFAMPISCSSYCIHTVSQKRSGRNLELRKYIFQNTENCTDTFGWHHWALFNRDAAIPELPCSVWPPCGLPQLTAPDYSNSGQGRRLFLLIWHHFPFLSLLCHWASHPGSLWQGLASLQLGSAGVLPLPDGRVEDLWSHSGLWALWGCGYRVSATELGVQLCGAVRLEWTARTGTPPYTVGLEWVRGCGWELHFLEPSEAPGTWQHGSSPASSVLHRTGSCGKHSIFRIWGSLEQGWGGLGQRLLLLQQRGQNSRKEEGPDEPLSCLYWAAERGACGRFSAAMGTAASIRPSQPEPCAGSCTPAFPSLEKWPQSLGWVLEARAVLASILPSHQGRLCSVYLWWLLSKSQACSPQIHLKTRGSSRWVGEKWVKSKM